SIRACRASWSGCPSGWFRVDDPTAPSTDERTRQGCPGWARARRTTTGSRWIRSSPLSFKVGFWLSVCLRDLERAAQGGTNSCRLQILQLMVQPADPAVGDRRRRHAAWLPTLLHLAAQGAPPRIEFLQPMRRLDQN